MADDLRRIEDPLEPILQPGPVATPAQVAQGIAGSLGLERTELQPPDWLKPEQAWSFSRVIPAIRRWGGALLADPVGSGKTYVALAVARQLNGRGPTVCILPALLRGQWTRVAQQLGIPILIHSHECLSRGRLPQEASGLVLIDECHHFRNPAIRRYRCLAPWLVGRCGLLLSATPVVNRTGDLAAQLRLLVRDDALRSHGVPSLSGMLEAGRSHSALSHLVISTPVADLQARPARTPREVRPASSYPAQVGDGLDGLRLSHRPEVATLIRGVLWQAAGSSPAALYGALRRYRLLLLQSEDARAGGRHLDRGALRRLTGSMPEQLVLWQLLNPEEEPSAADLAPDDVPAVEQLIAMVRPLVELADDKAECLRRILQDGKRTLIFTGARETVAYLRERLDTPRVAWCTGHRSGIGTLRLPRAAVLSHFGMRPPDHGGGARGPRCLVTTDVVAEGLDLQAAERVVHYDLPWTEVRVAQREGRALRRGSRHRSVEVIRFAPAPAIESRLHTARRLALKATLPGWVGLGPTGSHWWCWRDEIAAAIGPGAGVEGMAAAVDHYPGILVGVRMRLLLETGPGAGTVALVGWLPKGGVWCESPEVVTERLFTGLRAPADSSPSPSEVAGALGKVRPWVRARMSELLGPRWGPGPLSPASRQVMGRLRRLGAAAARRRETSALDLIDRALRFVAGGHTAGEEALIGDLLAGDDRVLLRTLPTLPRPTPLLCPQPPTLTGLILFRSGGGLAEPPQEGDS